MDFRIADTFTGSLAKLTGNEQKAVKTTAFDLQLNPTRPGLRFHKLDGARDPNFWSVRVSRDIRIIVHRTGSSLMLCYVGHHDDAYKWAERRRLETHPKTGAAQLVEVRERIREITVPVYSAAEQATPPKPLLFSDIAESELLGYGVPAEWVSDVRAADEDSLFELADHLPGEAAEALLELAVGGTPKPMQPVYVSGPSDQWAPGVRDSEPGEPMRPVSGSDPFEHPDARRRFRAVQDTAELERALDYPWDKWAVFLHPAQRQVAEGDYSGPFRVCGAAGTGKTVVAMHRAVFLARAHPDARVLLTTFSRTLAEFLRTQLRRLIHNEPRLAERVEVETIDRIGERLFRARIGSPNIATVVVVQELLKDSAVESQHHRFSLRFLLSEWPLLRGRPGAADFPDAVLLEGAGCRCPGSIPDAQAQLSNFPSNPDTDGPATRPRTRRCRWQRREPASNDFCIQWRAPGNTDFPDRIGRTWSCLNLVGGAPRRRCGFQGDCSLCAIPKSIGPRASCSS